MPRNVDASQRRAEIDQIVWEIIADEGIAAVTLRSIANHGGISMGRVQHYFRSRDEILRHSLESLIRLAQDTLTESSSPRDSLNRLLTHAIPRSEAERRGSKVWYTYLAEAITDPSISAIVNTVLQGTEDHATALLDGDRIRARTVLAAADGIAYRTLVGQLTPAQAEDAIEALIGPA